MLEATLTETNVFKKVIDCVKEIIEEANFDCSTKGISLEALDTSHVSLVNLNLKADGFENFRCDRPMTLGLNLTNMQKVLKIADGKDSLSLAAKDDADSIKFDFKSSDDERHSSFSLKLSEITSDQLGIPKVFSLFFCFAFLFTANFFFVKKSIKRLIIQHKSRCLLLNSKNYAKI